MEKLSHQIVAGIIRRNDEILLVEQKGPNDPASAWALPGGRAEPGELLPEALVREIAEETGIIVQMIGQLAYVAQFDNSNPEAIIGTGTPGSGYIATTFVFEITAWRGKIQTADPDDFILQAQFMPIDEAIRKLEETLSFRVMREPIVTFLRGDAKPGTMWFYRRHTDGQDTLVVRL